MTADATRLTSHADCTHATTKVARAACRRARARLAAATPVHTIVKSAEQLEAARLRIAAKGCQGTVKSGPRAGHRCSRPVVQGTVVCSGHARSFKI